MKSIRTFLASIHAWLCLAGVGYGFLLLAARHPWLFERLEPIPPGYWGGWALLALPVLLWPGCADRGWRGYLYLVRIGQRAMISRPFWFFCAVFTLVPALCWVFRIQRVDSGDIYHFINFARQGKAFLVEHAPLESWLRCLLVDFSHWITPAADLLLEFKLLSCLYGALYVYVVLQGCRRLPRPYSILGPLFLLVTPNLALFCGYLEIYGPTVIALVFFLLVGLLFLYDRASITAVSFSFGLAIAVAMWHGAAVWGYLYLVWLAWRRGKIGFAGVWIQLGLGLTPLLLALALLTPYSNPFAGFIARVGQPGLLIPFNQEAQLRGYTLFSLEHGADFATILLLQSLGASLWLGTVILAWPQRFFACFRRPSFLFLGWSTLGATLLAFFYYPFIGLPLDWDLYSFLFPSLTLLGVDMMNDGLFSRTWRKRLAVLVIALVALSSGWVLQNALFTRYPILGARLGPVASWLVPDFYLKMMNRSVKAGQERFLYLYGERALLESPNHYQDIMNFMDVWTLSTIARQTPEEFDTPGWAVDLAVSPQPNGPIYVFDRYGRVFQQVENHLVWLFAPETLVASPIVAGEIEGDGSVVLLNHAGQVFRIPPAQLQPTPEGEPVWAPLKEIFLYLPPCPSHLDFPVHLVDIVVQSATNRLLVMDNYNRVWDIHTKTLVLQGAPSKDLTVAMHLTSQGHPVTIDVNNQLSYDTGILRFPFKNPWFFPIVRDFWMTPDERGIVILDLNGNLHYSGLTPVFENAVLPGKIIDRFERLGFLPGKDALLLLDNRYRLVEIQVDPTGIVANSKLQGMVEGGNMTDAYNTMRVLWTKGSQFTSICYDLVDTERLRYFRGFTMYQEFDAIHLFVDAFPLQDDLIILLDRWGRLVYEMKGVYSLLEGSGITRWPRGEARDGTVSQDALFFLCEDATVWSYAFPLLLGQPHKPSQNAPQLWCNLKDFAAEARWVAIEAVPQSNRLIALSEAGLLIAIDLENQAKVWEHRLPPEAQFLFDLAVQVVPEGMAIAAMSPSGPIFQYTDWDDKTETIPGSYFGGPVISDLIFSSGLNVIATDQFGVMHQFQPSIEFSTKPYSVIRDVLGLRFLPSGSKALWIRTNGEFTWMNVAR